MEARNIYSQVPHSYYIRSVWAGESGLIPQSHFFHKKLRKSEFLTRDQQIKIKKKKERILLSKTYFFENLPFPLFGSLQYISVTFQ